MEARANLIPSYLLASSPQGLRLAMLRNNARMGAFVRYFDIQQWNGKWIAWFYSDLDSNDEILGGKK